MTVSKSQFYFDAVLEQVNSCDYLRYKQGKLGG